MQLHVTASAQRVCIGPLRPMRGQSPFRGRRSTRGLSAASPPLLKNEPYRPPHHHVRVADPVLWNLLGQ
jgi:hypothetical protein